jgi:hypothetical protein
VAGKVPYRRIFLPARNALLPYVSQSTGAEQEGLFLKCIGDLEEELPVRAGELARLLERPVVAVAQEEHRLPVELVGEEH